MKLSWLPYSLVFKHPFGLSYGTRTTTEVVFVKLECMEHTGYGEASLPPYLGETQESVISFFKKAKKILETVNSDPNVPTLLKQIDTIAEGNSAAKAALDIALHDLKGKINVRPVYSLYSLAHPEPKHTSATISIGELELLPEKIKEQNEFQILKIKLGRDNDLQILETIRKHTDKKLVLDANQGWKNKDFALEMTTELKNKNILIIEQPLEKNNLKDAEWLKERSSIPIIADESFKRLHDLDAVSKAFHGINIKLMKCTGIREAVSVIEAARKKDLKINLGCMTESSCAISAAAQLMGLVDWIDLDGPLLVNNDPFSGVEYAHGKIDLPYSNGIGADPLNELQFIS
jgi:L-alanine-DL-glutamate epimerase-like enolase superfamily enzyme